MAHVLAFVGMPGSGKGTCTDYLDSKGYPVVHFGQMIVEEVEARGQEVNEQNERVVREELREKEGKDVFAKRVAQRCAEHIADGHETVVIDGLYSWTEQKALREKFGTDLLLIAVYTPKKLRYERVATREYRPLTNEEAESRDIAEIENLEKGGPIAFADHLLHNTDTPEHLKAEVDELFAELEIEI